MAIKYSFVDNVAYGTEDINEITRSIIGAGVAPFVEKSSYNVSDLNVLTQAVVDVGVQLNGCRCSLSGVGTQCVVVDVAPGIIFFESGVRLDVDSDGYSIEIPSNTSGFVFALFRTELQKGDILFDTVLPDDGEVVVLAAVSDLGIVTDMRQIAESKVATVGKNVLGRFPFKRVTEAISYNGKFIVAKLSGIDISRFNYAIVVTTNVFSEDAVEYFPQIGFYTGFFNIVDNVLEYSLYPSGDEFKVDLDDCLYKSSDGFCYYLEVVGGELCLLCHCDEDEAEDAIESVYGCTACLM